MIMLIYPLSKAVTKDRRRIAVHGEPVNTQSNRQIGLIVMESCRGLGEKINKHLQELRYPGFGENPKNTAGKSFILPIEEIRFSTGDGKVVLDETSRGKDIYILCDVGNYSCTYNMFGITTHKGPDEHFQDIKRVLSAIGGRAKKITVIMPLLYSGRQHRRKLRESLDCALALQELERLGVDEILTFDAHDPNVQNAIPLLSFLNLYPTYEIVKTLIREEKELFLDKSKLLVISPDTGGMDRAIYYSSVLGVDIGLFYKRRDYSKVVNGKNPIVQHEYMGRCVEDQNILITDDMIASGQSIFDIAVELKKRKAQKIYVSTTFSFFTEGIKKFEEFHREGLIEKVYSTNLSYIPEEVKKSDWFKEVDMSRFISNIISDINMNKSIRPYIDSTEAINRLLTDTATIL